MRVWPEWIGQRLARYLSRPRDIGFHPATSPAGLVEAALRPGDVLLVEGTSRLSSAIKYLTQSTWSHAALYPVLPHVEPGTHPEVADEIHHIRHHSLFAPRDFDVSPYFDVIKPRVEAGFDYREIVWNDREDAGMTAGDR